MARSLSAGSSEYLQYAGAVASAAPLTVAGWGYFATLPSVAGTEYCIFQIAKSADNYSWFQLRIDDGDDTMEWSARDGAPYNCAEPSAACSAGSWFHWCGVEATSSSRACYLNGGNKGTDSNSHTPAGMDKTTIGCWASYGAAQQDYWDGLLAEIGLWSAALSDAEVAALATGVSPVLVRPASLVAYWPLLRTDQDLVGGYDMTAYNTPTWGAHPGQAISPFYRRPGLPLAATPSASTVPPLAYHRRRLWAA